MKINKAEYDRVQVSNGAYERLNVGGHKCEIKQVVETQSSTGKAMLQISFDTTSEDLQPNYYTNDWMNQEGAVKRWRGIHNIVMGTEYSMKNLKQFCTALTDSNGGKEYISAEGEVIIDAMKGAKVGIVFREEEYDPRSYKPDYEFKDGKFPTSVKSNYFCNYEDAMSKAAPKPKTLDIPVPGAKKENEFGFVDVAEDNPEGLPFR